jgi:ABC-type multidrug transport system fused ATPase/permease subunit
VPFDWPQHGEIRFEGVSTRYTPGQERDLDNVSFHVQPCSNIAIVGKANAGKSILALTLQRILELEAGRILIDGVDISKVDLQVLRSKITIIPDYSTIFQGTLKYNIDPFGRETDEVINTLVNDAGLNLLLNNACANNCAHLLDYAVEERGANLSNGVKQLICICRAVIRNTRILVLDEAFVGIDVRTEQKIGEMLKTHFKQATVLRVSHDCLLEVMHTDFVAVLDNGRLVEYDTPAALMMDPDSHFSKIVAD